MSSRTTSALRGRDVFASLIRSKNVPLPEHLVASVSKWSKMGISSRPQLIVPGVLSTSESFMRVSEHIARFVAEQHELHGKIVPNDGSPYYSIPGLLPNPAGLVPMDSRPLIAEGFAAREKDEPSGWWSALGARIGIPTLAADRKRFAETATYPAWFLGHIDCCVDVTWANPEPGAVAIKTEATMGAPHYTTDRGVKAQTIQLYTMSGREILACQARHDFVGAARFGVVNVSSGAYRLQLEAARLTPTGIEPAKLRRVQTWRGDYATAERRIGKLVSASSAAKFGWAAEVRSRLTMRARQLAAGELAADYPLRCMASGYTRARLRNWPRFFLIRSLAEARARFGAFRRVRAYDIKSNDQNMGRAIIRAMCKHVDRHYGGGGFLMDLKLRQPMHARADTPGAHGESVLTGDPFDIESYVAHVVNTSGNPWTGEYTFAHGGICAAETAYNMELYVGTYALPFSHEYVRAFMAGERPISAQVSGDNMAFMTNDERFFAHIEDASLFCPFAILERSDTFTGYVVTNDDATGRVNVDYNIDAVFRRTVFHDRGIDNKLRGDPMRGWADRTARYAHHPLGPAWFAELEAVSKKWWGAPLSEIYALVSAAQEESVSPVFNLTDVELEFLDDPSIVQWKYLPSEIRPELLEQAFISVPVSVVKRTIEMVAQCGGNYLFTDPNQ